jgi:uncharacterized protein (TIGR03435 family)
MRYVPAAVLFFAIVVAAQSPALEFDVASIKRSAVTGRVGSPLPAPGQITAVGITARTLVTRAYPALTPPFEIVGMPSWGDDTYDVAVRFRPNTTNAEQQQMWRALLADRMKLAAHYETRERPAYALVLARSDGKLGPNLKPSTLTCPPPEPGVRPTPPPQAVRDAQLAAVTEKKAPSAEIEALMMGQCRVAISVGDTMYAGAFSLGNFGSLLQSTVERQVVDRTGLTGLYAIKFTYARRPSPTRGPDDPPSVFTALREQLGLKLESTMVGAQVLVIDHIERPTEN